jgi:hypothetical protein
LLAAMFGLVPRASADDHGPGQPHPLEVLPAISTGLVTSALPLGQLLPLSAVPQLNNRPSAAAKLYLNFTGAPAQAWGGFSPTATPAYDTDGDPTTFSGTELDQINEIYQRVSEKYSPFNINVTTVDPGTYPYNQVARVVVGGDGAWAGGVYGGYGFVYGFSGSTSNTAWVFAKNLGKGLPKYVAEAAAHEAGHTFGLYHQSTYNGTVKVDEYRGGRDKEHPNAADPIMGFSYYANRGVWWDGLSSQGSFQPQGDVGILSTQIFGYRADDHGNDRAVATALALAEDQSTVSAAGVIEQISDADVFRFHSSGGLVDLYVDVAPFGPMLDLKASLTDAAGLPVFGADTAALGERVVALVGEGDYYRTVASHGNYGDIGQYSVFGTTVPEPLAGPVVLAVLGVGFAGRRRRGR